MLYSTDVQPSSTQPTANTPACGVNQVGCVKIGSCHPIIIRSLTLAVDNNTDEIPAA